MNIRDIQYFLAVAELEHFGKAAEQCHVSQPTLSGQIKKLEETWGVTLFERTNRRVMVTEVGKRMAESARRVMRELDAMQEMADMTQDPLAGKFCLGAFPTLSTYIFPEIVPRITQSLPKVRLILVEEKTAILVEKLKQGELDAAFLALPLPVPDDFLVSEPLFDDPFMLAVPSAHPLANATSIDQSTLAQHRLLLLEEGHCLRDQALDVCQLHGVSEEQDFRATGLETLRQMVKAGTGITFMPSIAVREGEEGIAYIPFTPPAPMRSIGLVWRKTTARSQVIQKIIEQVKR